MLRRLVQWLLDEWRWQLLCRSVKDRELLAAIEDAERHPERGASAVEYGLMIAAIAVVIVGAVFVLGNVVSTSYDKFGSDLQSCTDNPEKCKQTEAPPAAP